MNTHDIELPPLPSPIGIVDPESTTQTIYGMVDMAKYASAYARSAIEADRKRRGEPVGWPTHEFAIVIDRFYEGEGPSLAMWNGESYQFSDGDHDLYRGEDGSLGGYTAEWLTHRELERRLFCSQQIVKMMPSARPSGYAYRYPDGAIRFTSVGEINGSRPVETIPYWFSAPVAQEPVAFLCRECDEEGWSTYAVMPHEVPSTGEFLHVEPLYASPVAAPQPAEPVKEPSDAEIREVFLANGLTIKPGHDDLKPYVYQSARALLARYGAQQNNKETE